MSINLFLLVLKISDFMSEGKPKSFDEILREMASKKEDDEKKDYCQICGKFRGYDKECRGGKYPTPEIKECKKHE